MKKAQLYSQLYSQQVVTQAPSQPQEDTPESLADFLLQESNNLQHLFEGGYLNSATTVSCVQQNHASSQEDVSFLPQQTDTDLSFTDLIPLGSFSASNTTQRVSDSTVPSYFYDVAHNTQQDVQALSVISDESFEESSEEEDSESNYFQDTLNEETSIFDASAEYLSTMNIAWQQRFVPVFTNNYSFFNKEGKNESNTTLFAFFDKQKCRNIAFTQNDLDTTLVKNNPFSGFLIPLIQNKNVPNSTFNFQMPLLRQNYVDDLLFVNEEELKAQIQLIKKDYYALSLPNPQLEAFYLFHEGLILEIEPFSAPIGAFHLVKHHDVEESSVKIASFLTTIINNTILPQTLQELKEASNGLISALAIFLDPYIYEPKVKGDGSFFKTFLFQNSKQERLCKNFLLASNLSGEMLVVAPKLVESRLQTLASLLSKEENKNEILVVISLMFFKGEEYFSGSLDCEGLKPIKNQFFTKTPNATLLPTTILVPENYGDLVAQINGFNLKNTKILFFSINQGIAVELVNTKFSLIATSKSTGIKCLGMNISIENFKALFNKKSNYISVVAQSLKQNATQDQDVDIVFVMNNPLFCRESPLLVCARETCLEFQLKRLRQNLFAFINNQNLRTEFVFLKGFAERLEAFDILLAVSYEEECLSEGSLNKIQLVLNDAKQFFQNSGFIADLQREFGENLEQEFIVRNIFLEKTKKPKPYSPFIFRAQRRLLLREHIYQLDEKFHGEDEQASIRTFSISLCSLKILCKHQALKGNLYEYYVFPLEVRTRGKKSNFLTTLSRKKRLRQIIVKDDLEPTTCAPFEERFVPYDECGCFSDKEESLFLKDYFLQDVAVVEDITGKTVTALFKSSQIALTTFFHKAKQQTVALTKESFSSFTNAKAKCVKQIEPLRVRDVRIKAFNYLEPFLKQEYVDDCLFVNKAEMKLQMKLATKDLCVFSNPDCHVLQTFFMFHEGIVLELQPFSCILGSFYLQRQVEEGFSYKGCVQKNAKQIVLLLNQVLDKNKRTIKKGLKQATKASKDEIKHVLICCQNYILRFNVGQKPGVYKFSQFLSASKDRCFAQFSLLDLSSTALTPISALDLENALNKFIKSNIRSSLLFLFKLVFLNNLEQLNEMASKCGFRYVASTQETIQNRQAFKLQKQVYKCCPIVPYIADENITRLLTNVYDGALAVIENPNVGFVVNVLYTNEDVGLYSHNTTIKNLKKEYFSSLESEKQKNFDFQNNVALENLTVGYLIINPLYTHKQSCLVGVKEDCLQFQQFELSENLQKLSQGTPLETNFALLDGVVCRLEAFDVLVAVAFDGFDTTKNNLLIKNLFLTAKQFYENNGFLQSLQQQMETPLVIRAVLHSFSFFGRRSKKTNELLVGALGKEPFFYKRGFSANKEFMVDFSRLDLLFHEKYNPKFIGIKVYKLSLCSMQQLSRSALKQNSKYIYRILASEKSLATLHKNPRFVEFSDEEKPKREPQKRKKTKEDSNPSPKKKTKTNNNSKKR